jgi:tripeptidyl-peptidase I
VNGNDSTSTACINSLKAIPDVAAQGDRFRIWLSGVPRSIGGTSASSPTFTGIIALLNDARLRAKQPPLGFLNPLLYSKLYKGLNDITVGHNGGCGTWGFNVSCPCSSLVVI